MGIFFQTLRTVIGSTVVDFLYTPIWWYSRGLWKQLKGVAGSFVARQDALAIDVWLKNLFVPMYGQYDIVGRLISFFMRLAQIVGRAIALIIWAAFLLLWIIGWLLIPAAAAYLLDAQIMNFI
ncbi:hypothetical protein HYW17_05470 [Candidatus Uhrbacteria bacterium]|nr:hypothetical protein [Candidatus Uhrbacteria bacterium]